MNRSRKSFKKIAHERIDPVDLFYRLTGAIQSFHNQIDLSITKNEKTSKGRRRIFIHALQIDILQFLYEFQAK